MEVRTTVAHPVTDTSVRTAGTVSMRERSGLRSPLARIADTAARALGAPLACLYLSDPDGRSWESAHGAGAESLRMFIDEILPARSIPEKVVLVPHYESHYPMRGDGSAVRSGITVPVRVQGVPVGIICVADFRDRDFEADVDLVESFAELAETEILRRLESEHRRESDERFLAIMDNAVDLACIVNRDGVFTYLSPAVSRIFGHPREEMLGHAIYDGVLPDDLPTLKNSLNGCMRTPGGAFELEFKYLHPAGGLRHLRVRGRNSFDRPGVHGVVLNVRDVTDRIEFEEEIIKSRDRAEEMSRLKSVFLTNMSHEIRTPLTTILGFAEILDDEVGEEQKEFVQLIRQGGERLMDTLMSILDLARLESSSFDINPEQFDVAQRVWDICHLMEPLAQEKGLVLEVNAPNEPVMATLDVSAVERAVSALLSNGIKFTKQGSVTVTVEADDDLVLLHVADTGIGISNEFMPFLFEEFKQESEGLSRMHEGSGLGLSITKRLVELMKGDIMAESEKGQGTVFTVALPRHGDAALGTIDANGESRPRVLVVEDNADTRTLVNHLLRKNYEVVCASDGDEALTLAAEKNYDVLLVDINLGKGKSGEDVLHAVKSLPTYESTPVIAVTAYAMPGDRERFFSEGFDDYVSKPFSKQRLLEALEAVLE